MSRGKTVLVTGFPGPVATGVASALACQHGCRVVLLANQEHERAARDFAAETSPSMTVRLGSTRRIDFGLSGEDFRNLADQVRCIAHLEQESSNGTQAKVASREVIELATAAQAIEHVIVLSSLDVAGSHEGAFSEQDLDVGQKFASAGAADRFRAERVYRRWMHELPITVARAGLIASGDAAPPPALLLLLALDEVLPSPLKDHKGPLWLVELESLVCVLSRLACASGQSGGRTLQLIAPRLPAFGELVESVRKIVRTSLPLGFEIKLAARRLLRQRYGEAMSFPLEFFKAQPLEARFLSAYTTQVLAQHELALEPFANEVLERLAARAAEELGGFR